MIMRNSAGGESGGGRACADNRQNYKFQRLREAIRRAVQDGEYEDRLPGERQLGRLFNANAKTVNKALSDLCSEGLLVRQIGRGTFVADSNSAGRRGALRSLVRVLISQTGSVASRETVMRETRRQLVAAGHRLDERVVNGPAGDGIPLSEWPSATRSKTAGLVCHGGDPLSGRCAYPHDDCLAEAYRRHVPIITVGACAPTAKSNAVLPDYMDAGFQLAEHLLQLGCPELAVVSVAGGGREIDRVVSGARTAAMRRRRSVIRLELEAQRADQACRELSRIADGAPDVETAGGTGMICIGTTALRAAWSDPSVCAARRERRITIAAVLEPADALAESLGITSYSVDPQRVGQWTARLLIEYRPGQRPVEILIPGTLRVRDYSEQPNRQRPATHEQQFETPSPLPSLLAEAVI